MSSQLKIITQKEESEVNNSTNEIDAVATVLEDNKGFSLHSLAVQELPRSGKPDELIEKFGLSASKIAEKVRALIKQ